MISLFKTSASTALLLALVGPSSLETFSQTQSTIRSPTAPTAHSIMYWQWQERWAIREGDWKLIFNGTDTTDPWHGHPEPRRKIPEVFLGKLSDEQPELTNHAERQPKLVDRLLKVHEAWSKEVFGKSAL